MIEKKLRYLLGIELAILASIAAGIAVLPEPEASHYRLYELLGATLAASITTFGLRKMKSLTED